MLVWKCTQDAGRQDVQQRNQPGHNRCFWTRSSRPHTSLPHFDDAVSGRGNDEALRGLEGGDVSDDVMVSDRKGLWAAAGRVLHHTALLFAVNLLYWEQVVVRAALTSNNDWGQVAGSLPMQYIQHLFYRCVCVYVSVSVSLNERTCTTSVPSMIFRL